jgi:hypothetical protein
VILDFVCYLPAVRHANATGAASVISRRRTTADPSATTLPSDFLMVANVIPRLFVIGNVVGEFVYLW